MEDETDIANVIVTPDLYERERLVVTGSKFILAEGPLQKSGWSHSCEGFAPPVSLRSNAGGPLP
jgi:hypothetical protein